MGDRNNLDFTTAQSVDQGEGKPGKDVTPSASAIAGPSLRCLSHCLNGMSQFFSETMRRR
jgi:hypothetical protein